MADLWKRFKAWLRRVCGIEDTLVTRIKAEGSVNNAAPNTPNSARIREVYGRGGQSKPASFTPYPNIPDRTMRHYRANPSPVGTTLYEPSRNFTEEPTVYPCVHEIVSAQDPVEQFNDLINKSYEDSFRFGGGSSGGAGATDTWDPPSQPSYSPPEPSYTPSYEPSSPPCDPSPSTDCSSPSCDTSSPSCD